MDEPYIYIKKNYLKGLRDLSDRYHKLSLLMYELEKSLSYRARKVRSVKEFKKEVLMLGIDLDELKAVSKMTIKALGEKD